MSRGLRRCLADWSARPPRSDELRIARVESPALYRYRALVAQLASTIVVIIETDAGITGFAVGAGGRLAAENIHGHLVALLVDTNPLHFERRCEQMYGCAAE